MANNPQYVATPVLEITQIVTTNTARDGTGTMSLVCAGLTAASAAAIGKRINKVALTSQGTTTAGVVRFFLTVDGGTTRRLVAERLIAANTPGTSNTILRYEMPELAGLILPGTVGGLTAGLFASTNAGETFNIFVESGNL